MKLNKIFLGLIGMAALTMASCSDNDKYEWATVSGPQVYFSDALPTQYEIDPAGTTFNVPISRADASSSLTVNLTSTTANPMYTVPSSVSFDAGQTEANIPVAYDATKIEYGRYDDITITVADDSQATPWGIKEFTFKAGVTDWGPWQKWNSTGTADYTYVNFWSGDDVDLPFVYRHNMIKTNLYQFKLSNWGYGIEIIFDYDESTGYVTCAKQWTGYDHSSYGYVYAEDYNAYRIEKGAAAVPEGYGTFDKEQGIITIPLAYVVDAGSFGYDPEYIYIDGYVRADYSLSMSWGGIYTDATGAAFAVGMTEAGADVAEISSVVIEADADAAAVADAIAAGDLTATVSAPGMIYVPIPEGMTGKLQIVSAVVVKGELKSYAADGFEYYGGAPSPWKSLGIGYYTDDFVVPLYTEAGKSYTYQVEIEQNTDTPGLYRMVNAYAPVAEGFGEKGGKKNIEINAEDPEGVYILLQDTGLDFGDGAIGIMSWGARYLGTYDVATVKKNGLLGKLEKGVFSLPVLEREKSDGSKAYYQGLTTIGDGSYYGCPNGEFKVVLPTASTATRAAARSAAKATDFAIRLNGASLPAHKLQKHVRAIDVISNSIAK